MPEPLSDVAPGGADVTAPGASFASDVFKLGTGTALAQVLTILAAPILARLYGPSAFGIAALFQSITGIVSVVACLRYELTVMLPESHEEGANLLAVSLLSSVAVSAASVPALLLSRGLLLRWLKAGELGPYLWLVPVSVLLAGVFLGLNYWSTRRKQFGRLSFARLVSSVVATGSQVGTGYAGHGTAGSLVGTGVIGQAVSVLVLGGQVLRDDAVTLRRSVRPQEMLAGARRYIQFPLYGTWSALINAISWQLPAFLLASFFSPVVVGFYAFGFRLLNLPMSLVGQAIGQVFFQRAAEARAQGALAGVAESTYRRLVSFGMFPLLLLTLVGADVFHVIFGVRWIEAGVYVQLLSVWTFFWFLSSPMGMLFSVLEKQKFSLVLNIAIFLTRLGSLLVGGWLRSARLALLLFAATGILVYGYSSLKIMAYSGVRWSRMARILLDNVLVFLPAAVVVLCLKLLRASSWVVVAASCVLLAGYAVWLYTKDPQVRLLLRRPTRT
jgi:lipopolysaccharide exporter